MNKEEFLKNEIEKTRVCKECGKENDISEFILKYNILKNGEKSWYRYYFCRLCTNIKRKESPKQKKTRRKYQKKYKRKLRKKKYYMWQRKYKELLKLYKELLKNCLTK